MKITVTHTANGCECGCCGHAIEVYPDDTDDRCYHCFDFDHANNGQDLREFAQHLVEDFLRYNHPELLKDVDWSAMEVDAVDFDRCSL